MQYDAIEQNASCERLHGASTFLMEHSMFLLLRRSSATHDSALSFSGSRMQSRQIA